MTQRTPKQNRSAHAYFRLVSNEMNRNGITQRIFLESNLFDGMGMTEHSIKAAFQLVAMAMFGTNETHTLSSKEITEVYDQFNLSMGEAFGIHVPWPCDEPPMLEDRDIR